MGNENGKHSCVDQREFIDERLNWMPAPLQRFVRSRIKFLFLVTMEA